MMTSIEIENNRKKIVNMLRCLPVVSVKNLVYI